MCVERDVESRSCNHSCRGKAITIIYYECIFVLLFIQHAKCMRHIISSVASPTLPHFSTLSHQRQIPKNKKLLHIKCVFLFSLQILSETFLTVRRIQRDTIINVRRSSCKVPVVLVGF